MDSVGNSVPLRNMHSAQKGRTHSRRLSGLKTNIRSLIVWLSQFAGFFQRHAMASHSSSNFMRLKWTLDTFLCTYPVSLLNKIMSQTSIRLDKDCHLACSYPCRAHRHDAADKKPGLLAACPVNAHNASVSSVRIMAIFDSGFVVMADDREVHTI